MFKLKWNQIRKWKAHFFEQTIVEEMCLLYFLVYFI